MRFLEYGFDWVSYFPPITCSFRDFGYTSTQRFLTRTKAGYAAFKPTSEVVRSHSWLRSFHSVQIMVTVTRLVHHTPRPSPSKGRTGTTFTKKHTVYQRSTHQPRSWYKPRAFIHCWFHACFWLAEHMRVWIGEIRCFSAPMYIFRTLYGKRRKNLSYHLLLTVRPTNRQLSRGNDFCAAGGCLSED